MSKGTMAGCTDYSHQSLDDVLGDICAEADRVDEFVEHIERTIAGLKKSGYWDRKASSDFQSIVEYSLKHYKTTSAEFRDIIREANDEIQEHHCRRLYKIAEVARQINRDIGFVWHNRSGEPEYGTDDFRTLEEVYANTRNVAANLLDVSNMAGRLEDYVGKGSSRSSKNNPWVSGAFYLVSVVVLLGVVAVIAQLLSWVLLPVVVISAVILVGVIGALQLKNDGQLGDEAFVALMVESYKRLPLIGKRNSGDVRDI